MDTVKVKSKNTLMVAHRGLSGIETENTASAFVAAGCRTYYGVECDIRKTTDGKFIIFHDSTLERIAGINVAPESLSLKEAQDIILFDKDGKPGRRDLRIATLADYVSICKRYGKHCVIELKGEYTDAETAEFINIIDSYEYLPSVTFISFNYDNLLKVRKILPTQSAQYLFSNITDEVVEKLVKDKIDVDVHHSALTKENVDMMHSHGIKINCWTVDSKETAELLADWGVDYITTNILEGSV